MHKLHPRLVHQWGSHAPTWWTFDHNICQQPEGIPEYKQNRMHGEQICMHRENAARTLPLTSPIGAHNVPHSARSAAADRSRTDVGVQEVVQEVLLRTLGRCLHCSRPQKMAAAAMRTCRE
jgi:hypothetical protein